MSRACDEQLAVGLATLGCTALGTIVDEGAVIVRRSIAPKTKVQEQHRSEVRDISDVGSVAAKPKSEIGCSRPR